MLLNTCDRSQDPSTRWGLGCLSVLTWKTQSQSWSKGRDILRPEIQNHNRPKTLKNRKGNSSCRPMWFGSMYMYIRQSRTWLVLASIDRSPMYFTVWPCRLQMWRQSELIFNQTTCFLAAHVYCMDCWLWLGWAPLIRGEFTTKVMCWFVKNNYKMKMVVFLHNSWKLWTPSNVY